MAHRRDRNLLISAAATTVKRAVNGVVWRGIDIAPADQPQLRIRNAVRWFPFNERPDTCGWSAMSYGMLASLLKKPATVSLWFEDPATPGQPVAAPITLTLGGDLKPLTLPWPFSASPLPPDADLAIHVPASSASRAFLAVHRVIDRRNLVRLARGVGVEIGPGPKPQILPMQDVEVSYIEQMPPEDWEKLYNHTGKYQVDKALWQHYRIGEAHALPVPDGTLDFIFSSHVFEHLANPLGHLSHWRSKLRPGGLILAVVPDIAGTRDYIHKPCPLSDFLAEQDAGLIEPTLEHYLRWARHRAPEKDAAQLKADRRSIHVHFFTNRNMAELLQYAVDHLDFGWFHLRHTPNHKDFHFILARAPD